MNNKQSSLEWLVEELWQTSKDRFIWSDLLEQAKEMHKEEIKNAVGVGSQLDRDYLYGYHDKAEQYYNETFEGGNK